MYLFNRSINVNVRSDDGNIVVVDGVFLDTHHEICLTLTVDMSTYAITSAGGELRRTPHTDCPYTAERIKQLVGVIITPGVRKKVQTAVGGEPGCTHLADLAMECINGVIQAKYRLMHLHMAPAEVNTQVEAYLKGTCYHYRKNK